MIVTVPLVTSEMPIMAPALMKSVVLSHNKTCAAYDLNANVQHWIKNHQYPDQLIDFFFNGHYHDDVVDDLAEYFQETADLLLAHNPKVVGLSLFSYACQISAKYLCMMLKKQRPDITILLGGSGCYTELVADSNWVEGMRTSGLIDYYFTGDAIRSFDEFLGGNTTFSGINSPNWTQLTSEELESSPYPDYDEYDFGLYQIKAIPVFGSRGCVRKCTFCDLIEHWTKFTTRTADTVFQEMLYQNEKYGLREFKIQNSLVNGNLKDFKRLITLLAEHNTNNPENSFKWSSYFIFRPKEQFPEEWWEVTAKSGATALNVGIESLSEHVRYHMGKKFSNEDIEFSLEMGAKYNLRFYLMFIVGYVTETQEDIDFAAQWFRDHVHYKDNFIMTLGGTLGILPGTWLDRNKEELNIVVFNKPTQKWYNTVTGSNPQMRAQWCADLFKLCKELGYNVFESIDNHYVLEMMMRDKI